MAVDRGIMKANAPERLYLSKTIYNTYLYQVPDPDDETAVEYTRADAFLEKAISWLKEQDEMIGVSFQEDFLERFQDYMKGD